MLKLSVEVEVEAAADLLAAEAAAAEAVEALVDLLWAEAVEARAALAQAEVADPVAQALLRVRVTVETAEVQVVLVRHPVLARAEVADPVVPVLHLDQAMAELVDQVHLRDLLQVRAELVDPVHLTAQIPDHLPAPVQVFAERADLRLQHLPLTIHAHK
jgi:hypothetical protein